MFKFALRKAVAYAIPTTLGEPVQAFVLNALPPAKLVLAPDCYVEANRAAELATDRRSLLAEY